MQHHQDKKTAIKTDILQLRRV